MAEKQLAPRPIAPAGHFGAPLAQKETQRKIQEKRDCQIHEWHFPLRRSNREFDNLFSFSVPFVFLLRRGGPSFAGGGPPSFCRKAAGTPPMWCQQGGMTPPWGRFIVCLPVVSRPTRRRATFESASVRQNNPFKTGPQVPATEQETVFCQAYLIQSRSERAPYG